MSHDDLYQVAPSLGFAMRGNCAHSIRPGAARSGCSQCLGIPATRSTVVVHADFDVETINRIVAADNQRANRGWRALPSTPSSTQISEEERAARRARARTAAVARWDRPRAHEHASEAMLSVRGAGDVPHDARELARKMRTAGHTLAKIADAIEVSTSTAKRWSES